MYYEDVSNAPALGHGTTLLQLSTRLMSDELTVRVEDLTQPVLLMSETPTNPEP